MKLIIDDLGGNCPVQAEGTIDGRPFYFRARGSAWSFGVGDDPVGEPEWEYEQEYLGGPFAAGWMTEDEARSFIEYAAEKYATRDVPPPNDDGQPDEAQEWHDYDPQC